MILTAKEAQKVLQETNKPVFGWVELSEKHRSLIQLDKESLSRSLGSSDDPNFTYSLEENEDSIHIGEKKA